MHFKRHSELEGKHSFLSASKPHWINYDPERMVDAFRNARAAQRGTDLHALAHEAIRLGWKFANTNKTIDAYVNDCIGYRMQNEVALLVHPVLAFATADAIWFGPHPEPEAGFKFLLRIFDLKTGVKPADMRQLLIYAAYFCLEYNVRPMEIDYDLRIYQNDEIERWDPDPEEIVYIMAKAESSIQLLSETVDDYR